MLSLLALARSIEAGDLTPDAALAVSREAIAAREPTLKAFASLAAAMAPGPAGSPLAGLAVGIKDIIDTADLPTQMGCEALYGGWRPRADAAIVTMLRRAGASVAGKTASTAFAFMDPAPTLNPHGAAWTPGGSSSGSAAAVAAGLLPLAVGTQTGGSVIRPAAFCGVAAVKASFRLLPTVGVKTSAWTLDTLGLFAAGIADLALALEVLSGRPMRVDRADPGTPRLGILRQAYAGPAEAEGEAAFERALQAIGRAGFVLTEVSEPDALADAFAAHPTVQNFEMRHALGWEWAHGRESLPPLLRANLDAAQAISPADYDAARGRARRGRAAARSLFDGVDALVTLSAPGPAPGRETTGDPRFNKLLTLLGVPCVNVPGLRAADGRPIGLQVVAPFGRDAEALAVAALLEPILARAA